MVFFSWALALLAGLVQAAAMAWVIGPTVAQSDQCPAGGILGVVVCHGVAGW